MPGTFTHWMIVEEALRRYPAVYPEDKAAFAAIQARYPFVSLGAIAPDYPYVAEAPLKVLQPSSNSWADRMHFENTAGVVACGLGRLGAAGANRDLCAAFLFGYATHLVADAFAHPVVNLTVGGLPLWKGTEHRRCEMTWDSFVFKAVTNREIADDSYQQRLRECSDPADRHGLHPALVAFWSDALRAAHPGAAPDFGAIDPSCWHSAILLALEAAAHPIPLFRHLGEDLAYVYERTPDISPADRAAYLDAVKLPGGGTGSFKPAVFDPLVERVLNVWRPLLRNATAGDATGLATYLANWDLDRGIDLGDLSLWA